MKSHPDVDIPWDRTAWVQMDTKLRMTLPEGKAPDIAISYLIQEFAENDWLEDLTPYMEKPNPYYPKHKTWLDVFLHKPPLISLPGEKGYKIYSVPLNAVATTIYYSKKMFKNAGVTPPEDWEDWWPLTKKIRAAGYEPLGVNAFSAQE